MNALVPQNRRGDAYSGNQKDGRKLINLKDWPITVSRGGQSNLFLPLLFDFYTSKTYFPSVLLLEQMASLPIQLSKPKLRSHPQVFFSFPPTFNPLARVKYLPVVFFLPFSISISFQLCCYYAGRNYHRLWPGLLCHHLQLVPSLHSCCVIPEIQSSYCILPNPAWCGPCLPVWIISLDFYSLCLAI